MEKENDLPLGVDPSPLGVDPSPLTKEEVIQSVLGHVEKALYNIMDYIFRNTNINN